MKVCKRMAFLRYWVFSASLSLASVPVVLTETTAFADSGPGHSHSKTPKTEAEIKIAATEMRDELIKTGKITESWKNIFPGEAYQKDFKKGKEWVVTFKDSSYTDKTKDTLYLFFTLNGNYLAANFTGK